MELFLFRFLHPTNRARTRQYLFLNQSISWAVYLLAYFTYSMVIYAKHNEEAGILRITPFILSIVSFGPFFCAMHWAVSINPSYGNNYKSATTLELAPPLGRKYLFYTWQLVTIVTRLTSMVLMCFVYFEHWFEVGEKVKVALLMTMPYAILILVVNFGLQFACFGGTAGTALLSIFVPNDFRRSTVGHAGRYIILNVSFNLVLHLILWLTMTFYCWECTKVLDEYFSKLSVCFPVAIGFWMIGLLMTLITWRLSIRDSLNGDSMVAKDTYPHEKQDSGWPVKGDSVTTKF